MLLYLLEQENKSVEAVRDSEEEVREILQDRTMEEASQELDISVYDTERNEKAKKHRRELVCCALSTIFMHPAHFFAPSLF